MSYRKTLTLEDGITKVEIRSRSDPRWACPGGEVVAQLHPVLYHTKPSLLRIDELFEAIDIERAGGAKVGKNFPVFFCNILGAKEKNRRPGSGRPSYIEATVALRYCSNAAAAIGNEAVGLFLNHNPEEHEQDVVSTLLQLASYSIYGTSYGQREWPPQEHRTQPWDQVPHE